MQGERGIESRARLQKCVCASLGPVAGHDRFYTRSRLTLGDHDKPVTDENIVKRAFIFLEQSGLSGVYRNEDDTTKPPSVSP